MVAKDTAAVDFSVLARIAADIGAQSPDALRTLIEAYLTQADQWITDLTTAAHEGNTHTVGRIAHTLGSSSALLGAQTLADHLAEAARITGSDPGDRDDLATAAATTAAEYVRVVAALRAVMEPNGVNVFHPNRDPGPGLPTG